METKRKNQRGRKKKIHTHTEGILTRPNCLKFLSIEINKSSIKNYMIKKYKGMGIFFNL